MVESIEVVVRYIPARLDEAFEAAETVVLTDLIGPIVVVEPEELVVSLELVGATEVLGVTEVLASLEIVWATEVVGATGSGCVT